MTPPTPHDPPGTQKLPQQPDHSMKEEEPLGWDQAPISADDQPPEKARHPRQGGKGGTPDVGEKTQEG